MYGTGSDGTSAFEGFIAMVAPFSVMFVHFSNSSSEADAEAILKRDLDSHGLLVEWEALESELAHITSRVDRRTGLNTPELSVD